MKAIANLSVRRKNLPPPPKRKTAGDSRRATVDDDGILGQRLRLRRRELGISQSALGEELGLTFQQIQKYEKGVNRVPASRLKQLADFLQVPVTYFYGETGAGPEVESLLNLDGKFSVRLLRAYSKIESPEVAHSVVRLLEDMTRE